MKINHKASPFHQQFYNAGISGDAIDIEDDITPISDGPYESDPVSLYYTRALKKYKPSRFTHAKNCNPNRAIAISASKPINKGE